MSKENEKLTLLLDTAYSDREKLLGLICRITNNYDIAEDIFQEVCITIVKKANQFRGDSTPSTYLYRIAANRAFLYLRRPNGLKTALSIDETGISETLASRDNPEACLIAKDLIEKAKSGIVQEWHLAMFLKGVGYSLEEISMIFFGTATRVNAVKSRIHRGRKIARGILDLQ